MFISGARRGRFTFAFRCVSAFVCFCFFNEIILTDILRAPSSFASAQVYLSPNFVTPSASFLPAALKAIHINPQSPLNIDFIVDSADQPDLKQKDVNRLIQYFLAMMTTPEKDLWVNLSSYESRRVIVSQFGETAAGRDLLLQDNLLKQLAASLTYPESKIGKDFWRRVYKQAYAVYGTTDVPVDTFARVWITPQSAVVYEYNDTAFVTESRLKVLLEEDYLALKNARVNEWKVHLAQKVNSFSARITREIILPEIEREVNEGKNFAPLRQVFNALILAVWFKKKLRKNILSRIYVDQRKVKGIQDGSDQTVDKIYAKYLQVFKEGVYKYIREDYDDKSQSMVPRKYFSGGFSAGNSDEWLSIRNVSAMAISSREFFVRLGKKLIFAKVRLQPLASGGKTALNATWIKNFGLGKKISTGLLAGALWGSSFGAGAMLAEQNEKALFQMPVFTRQASTVEQPGYELLSSQKIMDELKAQVTLEDVLKLDGQVNQQTKKVYKIDSDYFKRNWAKVVSTTQASWAQQVLVVAYQHKMGLLEDGQIGPHTRMLVEKSFEAIKPVSNGDASDLQEIDFLPNYPDSAGGSGPPPDSVNETGSQQTGSADFFEGPAVVAQSDLSGDSLGAYLQKVYFWLFEILLSVLVGVQVFRIRRDYKKGSSDRTEFLKYLTRYL